MYTHTSWFVEVARAALRQSCSEVLRSLRVGVQRAPVKVRLCVRTSGAAPKAKRVNGGGILLC